MTGIKTNLLNLGNSFQTFKNKIMNNELKPFPMEGIDKWSIEQVMGYQSAVKDLLEWIKAETDFKPENRYIDSVTILDGIGETGNLITSALNNIKQKLTVGI